MTGPQGIKEKREKERACSPTMATRLVFESSNEIGVFSMLTNKYCLVCQGGSENFYSVFEAELAEHIPVVHCSVAGGRFVGRVVAGNKNGLLLPSTCTDQEMLHKELAARRRQVQPRRATVHGRHQCNDHVALIHTDFDRETEDIVADVLAWRCSGRQLQGTPLWGYARFSNTGDMVHPQTSVEDLEELSSLLQVPLVAGTVNRGSDVIALGCGQRLGCVLRLNTTSTEISVIESIFKLQDGAGGTRVRGCANLSSKASRRRRAL